MSAWVPRIDEWDRLGLEWTYLSESKYSPTEIPSHSQITLPRDNYIFNYPEGVLIIFSLLVDHPKCGWRLEAEPGIDTKDVFTVENTAIGLTNPDVAAYAIIPPTTPPGTYMIRIPAPWIFKESMKINAINTDSLPHYLLGHSYFIAVLKEERPR